MALVLGSCGGPQDPATEDLTAAEHEAEADREEAAAADRVRQSEAAPRKMHGVDTYDPAAGHLTDAEAHRAHAQAHRDQAAALRAFEEQECSQFPPSSREACPFLLGLESLEHIDGGARMTFAEGSDVEAVVDHIRCHLAFVAAQGSEGIDDCALYVPGTTVEQNGNVVVLTTPRDEHVDELRRRLNVQLTH
ncbi:MAG: hypothetical protein DRJ42_21810 [Deltaproteobacteria bacterium]|nr:MAG: hypothetical protein DRJ42_21810 [Deltaproteobacteria bacterium]